MMGALYRSVWLTSICRGFIYRYFILICYIMHHAAYKIRVLTCNPYFRHDIWSDKLFYKSSAISDDVACLRVATEYFLSKSSIVSMYEYPLSIIWNSPMLSLISYRIRYEYPWEVRRIHENHRLSDFYFIYY